MLPQKARAMQWVFAGVSGLFLFLSLAPQPYFFLAWIALLPLLMASREQSLKTSFLLGWVAGIVANLGNFYWIQELVVAHSAVPWPLALGVTVLLACQQGLKEAIWLGLSKRLEGGARWPILLYPTVYVTIEYLYPIIFPIHLADSQATCLLSHQAFDLAGPYGLSWIIVAFNVGLFYTVNERRFAFPSALAGGLLILTLVYGQFRISQYDKLCAEAPKLRVGLVQNNVGIGQFGWEEMQRQVQLAQELASSDQPDLIVFPETAIKTPPPPHRVKGEHPVELAPRFYPLDMTDCAQDHPQSVQLGYRTPVLFGCTLIDHERAGPIPDRPALSNGAFMLDEDGKVLGTALKNKLLLFGEHVPGAGMFPWIYTKILTKASALYPGEKPSVIPFQGKRIGVSICYEDILPVFSHQLLRNDPELLINLTNDGWFGDTAEPYTHLALARGRAVEARRYMVRSTCTGVSAFIDPLGRVIKKTNLNAIEAVSAEVGWLSVKSPFYHVGSAFAWLCIIATFVWLLASRREQGEEA